MMLTASFSRLVEAAIVPFAEVLTLAAFGYLLALPSVNVLNDKARRLLGKLVFALFLPCLIFAHLGDTLTLELMLLWWFIPVNVIIAAVSGCFMGLLVVAFARPPPRFYRLTIVMTGIGNIGNIPLAIVNSICRKKMDNPFGTPAECHHHGVAYIAFAQWIGAFIIYTFVYHMLEPPEEFYEIVAPDSDPNSAAALPDATNHILPTSLNGSFSPTPLPRNASLPILANDASPVLLGSQSPEPQPGGIWPSVQTLLPSSWLLQGQRSAYQRQQEREHYQRLITSPTQSSRQLLETEFPNLLEVTARAPHMKEPLLARLFRSLSRTNYEATAGSAGKEQAVTNGSAAVSAGAAASTAVGVDVGQEGRINGVDGCRGMQRRASDGKGGVQERGRESAVLDAMERNALGEEGEEPGRDSVSSRASWDGRSDAGAMGCSCTCASCREQRCVGSVHRSWTGRSSRDTDAAGSIDAGGCTCSITVEPCTGAGTEAGRGSEAGIGEGRGAGRGRASSGSSVSRSSCGDDGCSDCSGQDGETAGHEEKHAHAATASAGDAAAASAAAASAYAATASAAAAAAADNGCDDEEDEEGDDRECVPCLQEPYVVRKMRVVAEKTPIRHLMQPPVIASLLAILVGATPQLKALLFGSSAPLLFVVDSLTILAGGMIPCIMLVLGGNMISGPGGGSALGVRTTAAISFVRLLVSPLVGMVVVLVAEWMHFLPPGDKMFRLVLLLQHSMPSSILAGAMASLRGYGEKEVASLLFWQHILSAFSLTLFLALYLHWLI